MVSRIRSVLVLSTMLATSIVAFQSVSTAQTHPRQIAVQHNLWGARGGTALNLSIGQETVDRLEERMSEVYLVSLNEVCYWQWLQVQSLLTQALGYVPMAHWAIGTPTDRCAAGGGNGNDQSETVAPEFQTNTIYGSVIIGLVPQSGPWPTGASALYKRNPPYPPPPNQVKVTEYRGLACLYGLRPPYQPSQNVTACTTHLATDDGDTRAQLAELMNGAAPTVLANTPFFIMGDLNIYGLPPGATQDGPNESYILRDWFYPLFKEGDRSYGSGSKRSTSEYGAIDYVFRRVPNLFSDGPVILDVPNTDHHWFETYVWPAY